MSQLGTGAWRRANDSDREWPPETVLGEQLVQTVAQNGTRDEHDEGGEK